MKIKLVEIERRFPDRPRVMFGWEGNVPQPSEWFLCIQNGKPKAVEYPLNTAQIANRELNLPPMTRDSRVWISVRAPNGWRYSNSERLTIEKNPHSTLARLKKLCRRIIRIIWSPKADSF